MVAQLPCHNLLNNIDLVFLFHIRSLLCYNGRNLLILLTFATQLKHQRKYIGQMIGMMLLWVFAIALVPWSSLHHHEEVEKYCDKKGKMCLHRVHVGTERHNCLICFAHFEKDYTVTNATISLIVVSKLLTKSFSVLTDSYTALIGTSLRGPPAV